MSFNDSVKICDISGFTIAAVLSKKSTFNVFASPTFPPVKLYPPLHPERMERKQ
jgi:hypothetical protein